MLGCFAVSQHQRVEWKPGCEGVDANVAKASLPSVTSQGAHTKKRDGLDLYTEIKQFCTALDLFANVATKQSDRKKAASLLKHVDVEVESSQHPKQGRPPYSPSERVEPSTGSGLPPHGLDLASSAARAEPTRDIFACAPVDHK